MNTAPAARSQIRFRGRSFMALVLAPEPPVEAWLGDFDALTSRSPGYFAGRPVIVEASGLEARDIVALVDGLRGRDVRMIGLEGIDSAALGGDAARLPPVLSGGRPASPLIEIPGEGAKESAAKEEGPAAAVPERPQPASLLIDKPIRSGQTIYFPHGDVTVIGSIASGAEVVAGGSVHVYGTLRGRAVAGSSGNAKAQIFCRKFEPELVAIDGLYKMADDMDSKLRGRAVQARLEGDAIVLAALA